MSTSFRLKDELKKAQFFKKNFLLSNTSRKIELQILFVILENGIYHFQNIYLFGVLYHCQGFVNYQVNRTNYPKRIKQVKKKIC